MRCKIMRSKLRGWIHKCERRMSWLCHMRRLYETLNQGKSHSQTSGHQNKTLLKCRFKLLKHHSQRSKLRTHLSAMKLDVYRKWYVKLRNVNKQSFQPRRSENQRSRKWLPLNQLSQTLIMNKKRTILNNNLKIWNESMNKRKLNWLLSYPYERNKCKNMRNSC